MFRTGSLSVLAAWLATSSLTAADLDKIDRSLRKEPVYQTKTPKYGLLVFGPDASERVWLVHDGDTLYVDRNGTGDLTEPGKKVSAKVDKSRDPAEDGYTFEVGQLTVGGKVHKGLTVWLMPLAPYAANRTLARFPSVQTVLRADPHATTAMLTVDVESSRLKGDGLGGRLSFAAGAYDEHGALQFADKPAAAPIIHCDGPLRITFFGEVPTLRLGRDNDLVTAVGTLGRGPGTFARLAYEKTIPDDVHPTIEIVFPAVRETEPPVKEVFELKQRC